MTVEFLAGVIDHIAHPVFVKDRDFRFVLLNRALCDMVGHSREQMLGKTDYDFFTKEEADHFRHKDIEMFTSGSTVDISEEPLTTAQGDVRTLATIKVPQRDDAGEVTHLVGIIKDITEIKRAEETLRTANEQLELRVAQRTAALEAAQRELLRTERLAVLGQLAGGLAHQLRNPLGAIQNATALLAKGALNHVQAGARMVIIEEVSRADQTIGTLLDYARIQAPSRQQVDLASLVADVVTNEAVPSNIEVQVDPVAGIDAQIDTVQVRTALQNIVRNAIESMPHGGKLSVVICQESGRTDIVVTDTGQGVPEHARESLFEPLVTTKPLGIGLGLSIARTLVENHNGTIRYRPEPDVGSRFSIKRPAH